MLSLFDDLLRWYASASEMQPDVGIDEVRERKRRIKLPA